jgi:drug/metabolite transporter (DMT)-like permease
MGIILVFIAALMWSFVGILVKIASTMVSSSIISVARFLFGVIFLGVILLIRDRKISVHWKSKWIWIGAIAKSCNYIVENIAISRGYAYGNILVMPIQALFLIIVSAVYFKEKIEGRHWLAILLCILGVFLVSWNGLPMDVFFKTNVITTLLFTLTAIACGFHTLSQKVLIQSMDSGHMNFSVFLWSIILTALPTSFSFHLTGSFSVWAILALVALGLITGVSFYIYANALKRVSFVVAVILSNSSVLFTLLWSRLFYHEPITTYIVSGALLFLFGVILLNLPKDMFLWKEKSLTAIEK